MYWSRLRPPLGATDLLRACKKHGLVVVLASSAEEPEFNVLRSVLDAQDAIDAATFSGDVKSSKPAPDLVEAALSKAGAAAEEAVFIGDTVWDVQASQKAAVPCVGVLSGRLQRRRAHLGRRRGNIPRRGGTGGLPPGEPARQQLVTAKGACLMSAAQGDATTGGPGFPPPFRLEIPKDLHSGGSGSPRAPAGPPWGTFYHEELFPQGERRRGRGIFSVAVKPAGQVSRGGVYGGEIEPSADGVGSGDTLGGRGFATRQLPPEEAPRGYEMFRDKADGCTKVVLQPGH